MEKLACGTLFGGERAASPNPKASYFSSHPPPRRFGTECAVWRKRVLDDELSWEAREVGDTVVLRLSGVLSGRTVSRFEIAAGTLAKFGAQKILVSLAEVSYVSSAGWQCLRSFCDAARSVGGSVVLVEMPQKVRNAFELLGLDSVLSALGTESEALAH